MKKNIFFFFLFSTLIGCNYVFAIRKDKVIKRAEGYILFTKDEIGNFISDYFIPMEKVNTSKDPVSDLINNARKTGFRINLSVEKRSSYVTDHSIAYYNSFYDSLHILKFNEFNKQQFGTIHIVPVSIEYSEKKPDGIIEMESYKTKIDTTFILDNRKVVISFSKGKKIWLLNSYLLK
jgi:hypothetical protein